MKRAVNLMKVKVKGAACFNLGGLYYYGRGARQDFAKAKELVGKACDLGLQEGCDKYKKLQDAGY